MRPMRLGVTAPDGKTSEVAVEGPCAILGRSADAEVCLPDDTVSYRQLYLQAIGERVLAVDLFSANGLGWEDGQAFAWATPMRPFRIAGYRLWLLPDGRPVEDVTIPSPLDYKPREGGFSGYGVLPEVELRLLNRALEDELADQSGCYARGSGQPVPHHLRGRDGLEGALQPGAAAVGAVGGRPAGQRRDAGER
ncbi:MAG: hypothetical protein R3B90_20060 [Planctomycetaceae bacterium]